MARFLGNSGGELHVLKLAGGESQRNRHFDEAFTRVSRKLVDMKLLDRSSVTIEVCSSMVILCRMFLLKLYELPI